ncbi:DUF4333 domain-containing protein [Blastococcus sp. SYSU D00820]
MTQQLSHPQYAAQQYPPQPYGGPPLGSPGYGPPPPPRRRTGVVVGSVAGAVVVLGGLGVGAFLVLGTSTLDTAAAEERIVTLTQEETGVAATDVSCPADVEAEAGATFTCTAVLDGQGTSFTVRQTDDEGNVEITSDDDWVVVAEVEAFLLQEAEGQNDPGADVAITCDTDGRAVLVGDAAQEPIVCTATFPDSGDSIDVLVTVAEDGSITYEAV